MTKTQFDADDVRRTALSARIQDWFDAFWYRAPSNSGGRRIGQAVRRLPDRIGAIQMSLSARHVHAREIVATSLAAIATVGWAGQQTIVASKD